MNAIKTRIDNLSTGDTSLIVSTTEGWLEVFYGPAKAVAHSSGQKGLTSHLAAQGKKRIAYITNLEVAEPYHRKGIGSALVKETLRILKAQGIETVYIHLYPPSEPFWRKMGFKEYNCCDKDDFSVWQRKIL